MAVYLSDENGQLKKVAGNGAAGGLSGSTIISGGKEVDRFDADTKVDSIYTDSGVTTFIKNQGNQFGVAVIDQELSNENDSDFSHSVNMAGITVDDKSSVLQSYHFEPNANMTIANGVTVNNTGVELSSYNDQSTTANRITLNNEGISLDNWTDVNDLDDYGNKKTSLKITDKIYYNDKEIATKDDLSTLDSSNKSNKVNINLNFKTIGDYGEEEEGEIPLIFELYDDIDRKLFETNFNTNLDMTSGTLNNVNILSLFALTRILLGSSNVRECEYFWLSDMIGEDNIFSFNTSIGSYNESPLIGDGRWLINLYGKSLIRFIWDIVKSIYNNVSSYTNDEIYKPLINVCTKRYTEQSHYFGHLTDKDGFVTSNCDYNHIKMYCSYAGIDWDIYFKIIKFINISATDKDAYQEMLFIKFYDSDGVVQIALPTTPFNANDEDCLNFVKSWADISINSKSLSILALSDIADLNYKVNTPYATLKFFEHNLYNLSSQSIEFNGYIDDIDTHEKRFGMTQYPIIRLNTSGNISVDINNLEYEYTFEMVTQDKTDINLTLSNCSLPKDFVFKPYTTYVCKIINGNICVLDEFDAFPYTWIYGTYLSASSGKSFIFKSDFTVSYYDGSSSKTGTYNISKIDSLYSIHLNIADIAIDTITTTDINSFSYEEDTFTKTAL